MLNPVGELVINDERSGHRGRPRRTVHVSFSPDPDLGPDEHQEPFVVQAHDSRYTLHGDRLEVVGPDQEILVVAHDRPLVRLSGAEFEVDLTSVRDRVALGDGLDVAWTEFGRAAKADRTTGLRHRYETEPLAPRAEEAVLVWLTSDVVITSAAVTWFSSHPDLMTSDAGLVPMALRSSTETQQRWAAELPGLPAGTVVRYTIEALGSDGDTADVADAGCDYTFPSPLIPFARPSRYRFSYLVGTPAAPRWAEEAVIYHVLIDRFATKDGAQVDDHGVGLLGFAGGAIAGVTARLDHIAALGATAMWLSPVTAGDTHVCYDVRDPFAVEERLGTSDELRVLCTRAHELGLRVLLDVELSYLGSQHPAAVASRGCPEGPFAEWFHWSEDEPRRRFGWYGGNPTFVAVDHHQPDVRAHLLDSVRHWLEIGVDGFRLDSAHAAPFDFWTDFAVAVAVGYRCGGVFTVAEATHPLAWCRRFEGRLGGSLDFEVSSALRSLCAGQDGVAVSDLDALLAERAAMADDHPGLVLPAFIENHDGDRFSYLSRGDERRLRVALLVLCCLPGPPVLYYGTEIGLDQTEAGDCDLVARRAMPWTTPNLDRLDFVQNLVHGRRASESLTRGRYRSIVVGDKAGLWAFARVVHGEPAVVVVNLGGESRTVDLPIAGLAPGQRWICTISTDEEGPTLSAAGSNGGVPVSLPPVSACVLAPDQAPTD